MLFNSFEFLVFFLIVVIVFYCLPGNRKRIWLLLASLYFYMNWNPKYVLLMAFSIVTTYIGGLLLSKIDIMDMGVKIRKIVL